MENNIKLIYTKMEKSANRFSAANNSGQMDMVQPFSSVLPTPPPPPVEVAGRSVADLSLSDTTSQHGRNVWESCK